MVKHTSRRGRKVRRSGRKICGGRKTRRSQRRGGNAQCPTPPLCGFNQDPDMADQ